MYANFDNFSKLPQEIVIMIISLLPFIDAFRLCLLRKEWHYAQLWLHCCSFELSETSFLYTPARKRLLNIGQRNRSIELKHSGKLKFIDVLNSTFTNLVSPVLYKISFRMCYEFQYQELVDKWIQSALSKHVEVLNLDFSDGDPLETQCVLISYALPEIFYREGRSIRVLSLNSCSLGFCNFDSLFRLTSLTLTRVGVYLTEITHILTSCPLLETLSLVECNQLIKLDICFSMVRLKRLIVRYCDTLSLGVELCLPRLEYFEYTGSLVRFKLTQLNGLEQIVLNFYSDAVFPYQSEEIREFFSGFSNARSLTICSCALKVFPDEYLHGRPLFQSLNIKHLTLKTYMKRYEIPGILCLLKCSPYLETLSILLGIRRPMNEFLHDDFPRLPDELWTPTGWGLDHLQRVEINGFTGKMYEMILLKFIVRYSRMPLRIIIKPSTSVNSSIYSQKFADILHIENAAERVVISCC